MSQQFDVFLSYNTKNRAFVQTLYDELTRWGVQAWFDVKQMIGGDPIIETIDRGLQASRAIVVLVGGEGFSDYQKEESWAAIASAIKGGGRVRVLAVLLPGFSGAPEKTLPSSLTVRKWVTFSTAMSEDEPLEELMRAVLHEASDDRLGRFLERPKIPAKGNPPPPVRSDVDTAIGNLASAVRSFGTMTIFIGAGSGDPRPHEIARGLLANLQSVDYGVRALLPSMEVAGSYYEIERGALVLEADVVDLIRCGTQNARPRLQALVARLVDRLSALGASRRPPPEPPLIVTTAIDLMTERALLRAGVSFTRIVQGSSGAEIIVNEYKDVAVAGDEITVGAEPPLDAVGQPVGPRPDVFPIEDTETLDEVIRLRCRSTITDDNARDDPTHPIRDLVLDRFQTKGKPPRPILYKYHGSQDAPGSCALSADQYFKLAERRAIPTSIVQMIGNSSGLFLVCGGLDADVRHAYQTLLRRAYLDSKDVLRRYAIVRPARDPETDSYRQLETQMWPQVVDAVKERMNIKVLETNAEAFLLGLIDRLSR